MSSGFGISEVKTWPSQLIEVLSNQNQPLTPTGYKFELGRLKESFDLEEMIHLKYFNPTTRDMSAGGITLIAAATGEGSVDLDHVPTPARVGLVVGQEFDGVSPRTLAACDRIARIPMTQGVDSLNVGVAAAVCLHRFSTGRRT